MHGIVLRGRTNRVSSYPGPTSVSFCMQTRYLAYHPDRQYKSVPVTNASVTSEPTRMAYSL